MAAFRGLHVLPAKHSYAWLLTSLTTGQTDGRTDGRTNGWTDKQTPEKVIPMCRYASQATQKEISAKMHGNTILKSDWINNIGHTRVLRIGNSPILITYTKYCRKLKCDSKMMSIQAKAASDGVMNTENYNFYQFFNQTFDTLKTTMNQPSRP